MTKLLYNPYRLKNKKKARFSRKVILLVPPSFLILGSLFYFLFFSSRFQISPVRDTGISNGVGEIKISGIETISEDLLREKINRIISEKIYFFIPRNNLFLFPSKEIKTVFLEEFPKMKEVSVKKSLPNLIRIEIEERKMSAIWCNVLSNLPECFFIDKEGVVFENAPSSLGSLIFKINDKSFKKALQLGERIFEKEHINQLFKIKETLERNLNISFPEFTVLEGDVLEAKSSLGWRFIFDLSQNIENIETQLEVLKKILSEMEPEEKKVLEYFDSRIEGRIYYK